MKKRELKYNKISKKVYNYTAVFEPDEKDGGYTVTIPNLPGCISEGDNFEEALKNIKEATSLYLEVMKENKTNFFQENLGVIITPIQVMA
jgi:predicted RNase H-like HicB family nuclease